jgi:hypothetical protein
VALDPNDPAVQLAEATVATLRGDLGALDRVFTDLKPDTKTIARAYALCLTTSPYSQSEATRLIVSTLQFALAEKTAHKLNVLTAWLVVLTVLLVGFGVFDVVMRLRGCA